jgi:hypothetical protein
MIRTMETAVRRRTLRTTNRRRKVYVHIHILPSLWEGKSKVSAIRTGWPWVVTNPRLPALNSIAFGLAVYASQCGLLQRHAKLASSCWSGSTGRAFHPQGSDERFQSCKLHFIPLSQTFLAQSLKPMAVNWPKASGCWVVKKGPFDGTLDAGTCVSLSRSVREWSLASNQTLSEHWAITAQEHGGGCQRYSNQSPRAHGNKPGRRDWMEN